MVLIEHQIDSVKAALESIKHKSPDQVQAVNQEDLANIGSDGSFLHLDNGAVKLFEAKVTDLQHESIIATPIDDPLLSEFEGVADKEVVSEAEVDGICGSYQRPDITLYDRLQIAACFWHPERTWGTVTSLAQQYGTSRQTIYQIARQAKEGLSAASAGPKCRSPQTHTKHPSPPIPVGAVDAHNDIRARIILTSLFPGAVTMRPLA